MSFRVDAVEIMNRFTEYSPSRGETPLPLPIPGFWFKRICALADRVAKAENQNDDLNAQVAALTAALRDIYEACYAADCDGELDYRINGEILDAARIVLEGGEK